MMIDRPALRRLLLALLCACPLAPLLLAATATRSAAQEPAHRLAVSDTVYEIRLQDGSTFYGRVAALEADGVVLVTQSGARIQIARAQIRSAGPVRGELRDGEVWLEDPNRTRLFFGPTGRSLRAGEGYVGAFELFLPFVAFGVTDRITLAGGTPIVPGAMGEVFYLAPKVQVVSNERMQLSSGVLAFFDVGRNALEADDTDVVGILYGAGTWGSTDHAFTGGVGWGFAGSDVENRPAFMFGGETRVSRRIKLVTENYLISYENAVHEPHDPYEPSVGQPPQRQPSRTKIEYLGLASGGIRFFGERLAGDLGLGMAFGQGEGPVCCIPLVNFVYNFGGRR